VTEEPTSSGESTPAEAQDADTAPEQPTAVHDAGAAADDAATVVDEPVPAAVAPRAAPPPAAPPPAALPPAAPPATTSSAPPSPPLTGGPWVPTATGPKPPEPAPAPPAPPADIAARGGGIAAQSVPSYPTSAADGRSAASRPEIPIGGAFAGGLVVALILKRLAK
jgi:hypothetical protein